MRGTRERQNLNGLLLYYFSSQHANIGKLSFNLVFPLPMIPQSLECIKTTCENCLKIHLSYPLGPCYQRCEWTQESAPQVILMLVV